MEEKGTTHKISVFWEKQENGCIYIWQMIGELAYPQTFLVIPEDAIVISLRFIQEH
jgi:hypothetical protein